MTSSRRSMFFAAAMLALLDYTESVLAQAGRGRIVGRILDSSTAVIPGAEVIATQVAMGVHVDAKTNADGNYDLQYLLPGIYRIDVKAAGFKQYTRHPIEVRVGDTVTLDMTLDLGNL